LTDLHTANILFTVIAVEYTAFLLKVVVEAYGDLLADGYTKMPTRNINVENKRATKRNETIISTTKFVVILRNLELS
jgi:hypothetical protein